MSRLVGDVAALPEALPEGERPWCAGVALAAGTGSGPLVREASGWAVRYAAHDRELPRERWEPVRADTLFDLASLTKLFTTIVAVRALERGRIALDAPVASYAPAFTAAAEHGITVRQLLTHTSGLVPELPLYDCASAEERLTRLTCEPPATAPGTARRYSDLNFLLLQAVLEGAEGEPLDRLVHDTITGPLGMTSTRFRPPASWLPRIAATEDQRRPWGKLDRGMVRGTVHDENAYALGGIAGHAGLFATAGDLAVLCRTLLRGGDPLLAPSSVDLMLTAPGLGFEIDQPWFMGELAGRGAAGHTGFTGTSLVLDRATDSYLVLLANTVHPRRRPADNRPRAAAATALAHAVW
ncbi:serine hydrolase domain-containing protein [Streptomyces coffeae]|uniref:serine hydrolase domain-containing protein n=1 Tax=Streptomyces coffeae TaxID=621382 RepID=UPI001F3F0E7B|nr:serine hydrolase domain-containing protein [Streptomyces coffeae]